MTCLSLGSKRKEDKLSWGEETGRWCRKSVGEHEERSREWGQRSLAPRQQTGLLHISEASESDFSDRTPSPLSRKGKSLRAERRKPR